MTQLYCCTDGRHRPDYVDGKIVFLDRSLLAATCQLCGLRIERAHKRSPWWWSRSNPVVSETPSND